jgi:DNA helicase HerA-like ATPase
VSSTLNLKEVGVIVGEASSNQFLFASSSEDYPSKWEYLLVHSREEVDGRVVEVPVLAQVERIISASQALSTDRDVEALKRIVAAQIQDIRTWGRARVLGYLSGDGSQILQPRRAVTPGRPVYVAPKELLEKFYSFPPEKGLVIGRLITRGDVEAQLSVEGFRRHLAIIAQTGAGKSYCAGVLFEELLRKGATILVIDPHADYVLLSLSRENARHEFSDRVTVFRNPASTGRYAGRSLGNVRPYEIAFTDLDPDEVCDVALIPEGYRNIREAVRLALASLRGRRYTPEDLISALENPSWIPTDDQGRPDRKLLGACSSAIKYIRALAQLKVFTLSSTRVTDILRPMSVSVIDLSGLEDKAMNYIASRILYGVYEAVSKGDYEFPVFVFIEEAHRFVPPKEGGVTYAAPIINKIAAEGRKFGVFLTLITQRPSKVDSDSLSQCNSQIIMKLTNPDDQAAVRSSSERLSADLLEDLPGLNPGECVIVGEVAKAPLMVKVRPRITREGGADIDIIGKLAEARRWVEGDAQAWQGEGRRRPFTGELV